MPWNTESQTLRRIRERMSTPRASQRREYPLILPTTILVLLRISVQAASQEARAWLAGDADSVVLALDLVPFGGIAFLWFIGVVRARLDYFSHDQSRSRAYHSGEDGRVDLRHKQQLCFALALWTTETPS